MGREISPASTTTPWFRAVGSSRFVDWLERHRCSLAVTTYQTGKMIFVGRRLPEEPSSEQEQPLSLFERTFSHCMGMWASPDAKTIWFSSRYQIWRMERAPASLVPYASASPTSSGDVPAEIPPWAGKGYDAVYLPRVGYTTGYIDVHDMAVDSSGRLIFVCTMFGCLATLSDQANFKPLWRPPFLSALVPEDRCHLNGLAMREGRAAFVTLVGRSDVPDGWRDQRLNGGCVLEVESGETVCSGLSMPHSPRWYRDRLWLLNSGTGEFGWVDLATGRFQPVTFCPGYLRGMAFHGDYAIISLSKPRHERFQGLDLEASITRKEVTAECGVQIIHLPTGTVEAWLRFDGTLVSELYDVAVLPGVRQPMAIGFKNNEIERLMLIEE